MELRKYIDDNFYFELSKGHNSFLDNYFIPNSKNWGKSCEHFKKYIKHNAFKCMRCYGVRQLNSSNIGEVELQFSDVESAMSDIFESYKEELFELCGNIVRGIFNLPNNFIFSMDYELTDDRLNHNKSKPTQNNDFSSKEEDRTRFKKSFICGLPFSVINECYKYEHEFDEIDSHIYKNITSYLTYNLFASFAYPLEMVEYPKGNFSFYQTDEGEIKILIECNDFFECFISMISAVCCWVLDCDVDGLDVTQEDIRGAIVFLAELMGETKIPLGDLLQKIKRYSDEDLLEFFNESIKVGGIT